MKTVPLRGKAGAGKAALVDDEDYELVSRHLWRVRYEERPGRRPAGPYAATEVMVEERKPGTREHKRRRIFMHKLITGWPEADHINHDGLDNRRVNLRPGSEGVNTRNSQSSIRGASRYKGVMWDGQRNKWHAAIKVNGRKIHLGHYGLREEEAAARAYDAAAWHFWEEEAYLNFPQVEGEAAKVVAAIIQRYSERYPGVSKRPPRWTRGTPVTADEAIAKAWKITGNDECDGVTFDAASDQWWRVTASCLHGKYTGTSKGPMDVSTAFTSAVRKLAQAHSQSGDLSSRLVNPPGP